MTPSEPQDVQTARRALEKLTNQIHDLKGAAAFHTLVPELRRLIQAVCATTYTVTYPNGYSDITKYTVDRAQNANQTALKLVQIARDNVEVAEKVLKKEGQA